eukprot:gene15395-23540_t
MQRPVALPQELSPREEDDAADSRLVQAAEAAADENEAAGSRQASPPARDPWGNSTPCCGRVLKRSPDACALVFVDVLVIVPSVFFLTQVAHDPGVRIFTAAVLVCNLLSSSFACFIDPGIIPAKPAPAGDVSSPPVVIDSTRRYCTSCNLLRPPRAAHCYVCNVCVDEYDHHCGLLGTCIGVRNYRYFVFFLFTTALLSSWVFYWTATAVMNQWTGRSFNRKKPDVVAIMRAGLLIYALVMALSIGSFACYYCYLTATDQTERENLKGLARRGPGGGCFSYAATWYRRLFGAKPTSSVSGMPHRQ